MIVRNFGYWDKVEGNVDEVVFTPIGNDATRVAALLSGEIDVMEPVPLQDVDRVKSAGKFTVLQGPELRTIFLGMDQKRDELLFVQRQGQEPVQGQAGAPGLLPGHRHRSHQVARDARCGHAHGADGRPRRHAASRPT